MANTSDDIVDPNAIISKPTSILRTFFCLTPAISRRESVNATEAGSWSSLGAAKDRYCDLDVSRPPQVFRKLSKILVGGLMSLRS